MKRRIIKSATAILVLLLCIVTLQMSAEKVSASEASDQYSFHVTYEGCTPKQFGQYVTGGDIRDGMTFHNYGIHTMVIPDYFYKAEYHYNTQYSDLKVPGVLNDAPEMEILKLEINGKDYAPAIPSLSSLYSMDGWDDAESSIEVDGVVCAENQDDPFMSGNVSLVAQSGALQLMFSNTAVSKDVEIHIVFAGAASQDQPALTIPEDQKDLGTVKVNFVKNIVDGARWEVFSEPAQGYRLDKVVGTEGQEYTSIDGRTVLLDVKKEADPFTVYFREEKSPVQNVVIANYGCCSTSILWLNVLAGISQDEYEPEYTLHYFLTHKAQGTIEDAVVQGEPITLQDEAKLIQHKDPEQVLRDSKLPGGLLIKNLTAGQYYVGCAVTTDAHTYYTYTPFRVYESAGEYAKEGLDRLIDTYRTSWFLKNGRYVGLDEETDDYGNEWEAWIFTALGDCYLRGEESIDFSPSSPFLHPGRNNYLARYTSKKSEKALSSRGAKQLFKDITSIIAFGGDPRNIGGNDYVKALVRIFCREDGTPAIDGRGKVYLTDYPDEEIDTLVLSYGILGLEIAGASPKDGYTDALKKASIKTLVDDLKDMDSEHSVADISMMSLIPLYFVQGDPDYGRDCKRILTNARSLITNYNLSSNGAMQYVSGKDGAETIWGTPNANTSAVTINTLVLAGLTADRMASDDFQKEYGSLLTSLCGEITEDGVLYGGTPNRMATYQTLGALVDLYNGKSCFQIAAEKYRRNYPQYFREEKPQSEPAAKPATKPVPRPVSYAPGKVALSKVKPGKKKLTVKWKNVSKASGYQVAVQQKGKAWKYYNTRSGKLVVKKLKRKKLHAVKVRAYRMVKGKRYYGAWSAVKRVKVK